MPYRNCAILWSMKKNDQHKNIQSQDEKILFSKLEVNYSKGKEDIWNQMEKEIDKKLTQAPKKSQLIKLNLAKISIAASIFVLLGVGAFLRFYTISIHVASKDRLIHVLPDGSKIHINSVSNISYHPYWWYFSREVELHGEAFFEVAKGKKFNVISNLGSTQVLGTSFNIYNRENDYQVYCLHGKVKVLDLNQNNVVLTPGEYATKDRNGKINEINNRSEDEILAWKMNKFIYNTTSLSKVFKDFERQYDISIKTQLEVDDLLFTGIFERSVSSEDALMIICSSFGLNFEKTVKNTYLIK